MYAYIYITEIKKTTESIQPAITPHRPCHLQRISTQIQWQSPRHFDLKWWFTQGLLYYQPRQCMVVFPRKSKKKCLGDVYCLFDSHQKMGNFISLGNLLPQNDARNPGKEWELPDSKTL